MGFSTLQDWVGAWKELKQWCLHKVDGIPSGIKEAGIWYDSQAQRPMWYDGTRERYFTRVHLHAGVVGDYPVLTNLSGGQVQCGACRVALYDNPDNVGEPTEYDIAQKTLALTDKGSELVIVDYNDGSPEYKVANAWSLSDYNLSSNIVIDKKYYAFGDIHTTEFAYRTNDLPTILALRAAQTEPYKRVGNRGLEPSASGLTLIVSESVVWSGPKRIDVLAFNSSTDATEKIYLDSAGAAQSVPVTGFDTANYNPLGSGLVALNNNYWTAAWIYRTIGEDKECYIVVHNEQYNSRDNARTGAKTRAINEPVINEHSILIGRAIFQKGATTVEIDSAWDTVFAGGNTSDHESLTGLLGGNATNGHYHVTQAQNGYIANAGLANGFALLDANANLPSATMKATLSDNAASSTLPTTGTATTVVTLLQSIRDNLKSLFAKLTDGSVTRVGTATVGSSGKPIYLNAGTPTALSATVGSATVPTYYNAGQPTACTSLSLATTGNAATATKLATARTVTLSGDVGATGSFDGSANLSLSATLANSGVTAGTYTKTTVDAKGRVTAGASAGVADVSGLQAALDAKQAALTFDATPTDGSTNPVTSNGVFDALATKANNPVTTTLNGNGNWFDGGIFIQTGVYDGFKMAILDIVALAGGTLDAHWTARVELSQLYVGGVLKTKARIISGAGYEGLLYSRGEATAYTLRTYLSIKSNAYQVIKIDVVFGDASLYGNTATSVTGLPVEADDQTTVITADATLPAGAPIGKSVFVACNAGLSVVVTAPSGEGIYEAQKLFSFVTLPSGYYGRWFVKTTSTAWTRT